MNSTPRTPRGVKRFSSAALVIGSTVAVLASPLAIGSASAAASNVTITAGGGANGPAGTGPTHALPLTVTFTGTAPIDYTVTSGPDTSFPNLTGTPCTITAPGTASCAIANDGGDGTDSVIVFADNDASGTFSTGDSSAQTSVTFSGVPFAVTMVPVRNQATHTLTTDTNTCEVFKISAFDSTGEPAGGRSIVPTVSETEPLADVANPFLFYYPLAANGVCSGAGNPGVTTADPNPTATTHKLITSGLVTTGSDGTVEFGLESDTAGTGAITALAAPNVNDTDTITWVAGGADAVTALTATPTSSAGYTGTTATFTVRATDVGGNPVQGVSVGDQTNNGPGTVAPTSCPGTTDQNGNITCTVTNGGTSGTDSQTFFVNNDSPNCSHTAGADSCEPQASVTAQFNAIPAYTTHTLTCVQQLNNAQQGQGVTSCTVPTTQHSIDFSETLENNGTPVAGAIVDFSGVGTLGGAVASPSGSATTNANGVAIFTVPDPSAQAGDGVVVSSKIGNTSLDNANGFWATPTATSLAVTPPVQSVTKGGAVSVKVNIVDQFGTGVAASNSLSYVVSGRNNGRNGIVTSDSTGSATISYTDAGTNAASTTDSISVTDTTSPLTGSAIVDYINGTTTASTVAVDTSGSGTSDGTCNATGHVAATNVALTHQTEVCAVVKNAAAEALAGKAVTFTVSNGQVGAHGGLASTSTVTYNATTDSSGVAFADVTSTKSGAQTVTAAADAVTGTGTVTYATPAIATARNVVVAPATATVTAGTPEKFTFTVTDQYGNGVPGVSVLATQSGAGILSGGNASVITAADGTASVQLITQTTDTGTGSVAGNISGGNVCGFAAGNPTGTTAGNCTATATYTIAPPITPANVVIVSAPGGKVGAEELVAATVTNTDGTPAVNQVVRYTISGANSAHGAVVTNAKGVALFGFVPTHAGSNTVTAYDDVNDNQVRDSTEPQGVGTVSIAEATEKPTVRLTSGKGTVTIHVTTHPTLSSAKVTYYVKHLGSFTKIGSGKTGHAGNASQTFIEGKGVTYTFRAKVTGKSGVKTGTSKSKSIKVKK